MKNLLQETRQFISEHDLHMHDIIFIGSGESGHQCTWKEFCNLARDLFYKGDGAGVIVDLTIVFASGHQMMRETGVDERWVLLEPFRIPKNPKPIHTLAGDYVTFEERDEELLEEGKK